MDFEIDPSTKKGIIWFRRGGITSMSKVVNTNTQNFDLHGQLVSVVVPNPVATINLAGIPCSTEEHDHIRDHLLRHQNLKSGG